MLSTEKETQKDIIQYLTLKGIFCYRQNSGAFKTESGGFYKMGVVGAPDIVAVIKGRYIALEVKDAKGVQNDNQKRFQSSIEASGGIYRVIRSLDEVINLVKTL